MRPGDDASCLNLYEPKNPLFWRRKTVFESRTVRLPVFAGINPAGKGRSLGAASSKGGRWSDSCHRGANSMTYVLHRNSEKLRDHKPRAGSPSAFRRRTLGQIFQSELLMSQENF